MNSGDYKWKRRAFQIDFDSFHAKRSRAAEWGETESASALRADLSFESGKRVDGWKESRESVSNRENNKGEMTKSDPVQ